MRPDNDFKPSSPKLAEKIIGDAIKHLVQPPNNLGCSLQVLEALLDAAAVVYTLMQEKKSSLLCINYTRVSRSKKLFASSESFFPLSFFYDDDDVSYLCTKAQIAMIAL